MDNLSEQLRFAVIQLGGAAKHRDRLLEVAASKAGISIRTAKALYYREMSNPRISIVDKVMSALRQQKRTETRAARNELETLYARIARLEEALGITAHDDGAAADAVDRAGRAASGSMD